MTPPTTTSRHIFEVYIGGTTGDAEGHAATGPDLRVGDADREAVAAALREHYATGRADPGGVRTSASRSAFAATDAEPAQPRSPATCPRSAAPAARPPVPGARDAERERSRAPSAGAALPGHAWACSRRSSRRSRTWAADRRPALEPVPAAGQAGHLPAGLRPGPRDIPPGMALGPGWRPRGLRPLVVALPGRAGRLPSS